MRYLSAFLITSFIYSAFVVVYFGFIQFNTKVSKTIENKRVSLNHVLIIKEKPIAQKVMVKQQEKPKIKEKRIVKKNVKKIVKKKVHKPQEIKKVVKKQFEVNKNKKIEDVKKVLVEEKLVSNTVKKVSYKDEFLQKNLLLIKKLIQNHVNYSKRARKMNIQGDVMVEFFITKSGNILNIKTVSGHKLLRKSTIKAIKKASLYFPKVQKDILIKIPIEYKLL